MKQYFSHLAGCLSITAVLVIQGCGGSDSAAPLSPPIAVPPPAVTTIEVPITVVDGAIQNATVCLDKNNNGICDAGEASGKTDATGKLTLKVDNAEAGKFPILALVGTDAVDADTGRVPVAFTLKAPADRPAVVSPLTTMVQNVIENTGVNTATAETQIQTQTGIKVSLFDDFTKSASADSLAARRFARMAVVFMQQQSSVLSSTLGGTAMDGAIIRAADINRLVQNRLLEMLPALLTRLTDASVQNAATPADTEAVLLAGAKAVVAAATTGLTSASVATLVAINNQNASPATADAPTASTMLRTLNFTDTNSWAARLNVSTLAQAMPDAAGFTKYVQRRHITERGGTAAWTTLGESPNRQADLHFNGSAWVRCALNTEDKASVRNANGISTYNVCDNYETGTSQRATFDVSGKSMLEVYNQINAAGYNNLTIGSPASALGTATFPANSKVFYQTDSSASTAVSYYNGISNRVPQYLAAQGAGDKFACGLNPTTVLFGGDSTTFENLISVAIGKPCDYAQYKTPDEYYTYLNLTGDLRHEVWNATTLSMGLLGTSRFSRGGANGAYYSDIKELRVAFKGDGSNAVTYYSCKITDIAGPSLNCDVIGTGTYAIMTQGDGRILTLNNQPQIAIGLGYERVFVEREGRVFAGYKNNLGVSNSARLNLPATSALFSKLGLPAVDVDTPLKLTADSYTGAWDLVLDGLERYPVRLFIYPAGYTLCERVGGPRNMGNRECVLNFTNLATGELSVTINDYYAGENRSLVPTPLIFNFLTGQITGSLEGQKCATRYCSGPFIAERR